jgi:acetolactate synthase-1/2/3 large subunit
MKYAELTVDWLAELGYTHCFFVAGGNSMHLLDAVRKRMTCVPVVHEVAAGIAVEYFNESGAGPDRPRAFALVTAGPGLTNIVTAMAGAYLESRELLVLGGQVKSSDLAGPSLRQRGIQEVDGTAIVAPVCVATERIERPIGRERFTQLVDAGRTGRHGPVFIEYCLDAQGAPVQREELEGAVASDASRPGVPQPLTPALSGAEAADRIAELMAGAQRPLWLLGGGVSRETVRDVLPRLRAAGVPLMTTWNGMDRLGDDEPLNFGRPNTWGQRAANVLLAQADVVVALGTRLGLQQTGFNWQEFAPAGRVAQVDIDPSELEKGHPHVELPLAADADATLAALAAKAFATFEPWVTFCTEVTAALPHDDPANETAPGYLSPFAFAHELSDRCGAEDVVIPCSSGGAFTTMMQAFGVKAGQTVVTDKGLASMGYGLSGAIGAALAHRDRRTVLVEGDGGFAQNLQELATVKVNDLNLKIFIFANNGYASIRMTQRNYFGGEYLGCDTQTGLGFPDWSALFSAFGIPVHDLAAGWSGDDPRFAELFDAPGPAGFIVPIDPEQTYYPKIASRVAEGGGMESNPLHLMSPDLPPDVAERVLPYLDRAAQAQGATS